MKVRKKECASEFDDTVKEDSLCLSVVFRHFMKKCLKTNKNVVTYIILMKSYISIFRVNRFIEKRKGV